MADKASPSVPTRPLGTTGMNITRVGVGHLGHRRPELGVWLGPAGRRGIDRHHKACAGALA